MLKQLMAAGLVVTLAYLSRPARAQPVSCQGDEQCDLGYYCGAHSCLECLRCEDFHRDSSGVSPVCIKSFLECGSCFDGLVESKVNGGCVSPQTSDGGGGTGEGSGAGTSPFVWLGVAGALVVSFVVLGFALFMYLNRNNPETLTIGTSAHVHLPQDAEASAPSANGLPTNDFPPTNTFPPVNGFPPPNGFLPPPPYNPNDPYTDSLNHGEDALLLAKSSGESLRPGARELAGNYSAMPFDHPRVRNIPLPESAIPVPNEPDSRPDTPNDEAGAPEDLDVPFAVHDENTMESGWRPAIDNTSNNNNIAVPVGATKSQGSNGLSQTPAVRPSSNADIGPPAKIPCLQQDTNNNRNNGSGASSSDESTSASASGGRNPSVTLNFNLNVNASALQQVNNLSL